MARITLHSDGSSLSTSVSNNFIDEYMADANGEFVKIYLYLLRLMNQPGTAFSISSIADKFEHTEKDVKRALSYWERMRLLRLEYDDAHNLTGICLLDSTQKPEPQQEKPAKPDTGIPDVPAKKDSADVPARKQDATDVPTREAYTAEIPEQKQYTADDISDFQKDDAVAELFFITERYLGRTLNATDINTVLYLYDGLHFPAELIEYLIEYCVSKGHTSIRYIEKTALGWAAERIHTVEQAKRSACIHNQTFFGVQKALGIKGRSLVPSETAYIEKWKNTYGFSGELILEACRRTITITHQPSFEYTDSILTNWHKHQVKNTADIANLDLIYQNKKKTAAAPAASKNRFNNFKQRTYDYDQLEKLLLTTDAR